MASTPAVIVHPDEQAAAVAAASAIARAISHAQAARGDAAVAVSGGSTATPMFAALADLPIDWEHVQLYQVDERVVADHHRDRNATALADHLLSRISILPGHVHLMPVLDPDLHAAAQTYGRGLPRLDVVHLGLGPDGHTASWPPGDPVVESPDPVEVTGVFNRYRRMTLTPQAVDRARSVIWLITSAHKHAALVALTERSPQIPASRALDHRSVLYVDQAAASGAA